MRTIGVLLLLSVACAGCGPTVDLSKGLQVLDVSTGWTDVGIVNGQNKLVPSVAFKLKNVSDQSLIALQVNALFRQNGETEEWGSGYLVVAQSEGLAPGATTKTLTAQSTKGYTGDEPRADMLKNARFVDANVKLFAKYGPVNWTAVGEYPVTRQLLTR